MCFFFLLTVFVLYHLSELSNSYTLRNELISNAIRKRPNSCNSSSDNAVCFFGRRFCQPGFTGEFCTEKLKVANPWYTDDCPNLDQPRTYDENMPKSLLSSGKNCPNEAGFKLASKCAYLCFSHEVTGVAQIPLNLWKEVQQNEFELWTKIVAYDNDRGNEHLQGFSNYSKLPETLGNYLEIGCGPYTQTQFIIDHQFESITLLDPGANNYILHVANCTYRDGTLRGKKVNVLSFGGEKLEDEKYKDAFDTILAVNVIEHVWDAYKFLNNIYNSLKQGGILIYHDRFYPTPGYGDGVLGAGNWFHPIRLTRTVYEQFFKNFDTIYMFDGQTIEQMNRKLGEVGFYFIGIKI